MIVNLVDLVVEVLELGLPLISVLVAEYISGEGFEFSNLISDSLTLYVDLIGATCDLLEVWTENGEELLDDFVGLSEILEHTDHVHGSDKDLLLGLEVPPLHCLLIFDVFLGGVKFLSPLLEHNNALSDHLDGILWSLHLEDLGDVNLGLDFIADLAGNTGEDVFELGLLVIDMP